MGKNNKESAREKGEKDWMEKVSIRSRSSGTEQKEAVDEAEKSISFILICSDCSFS